MAAANGFLFSQQNFMTSSFSNFYAMKKNEELIDVTIRVGSLVVSAHRIVLAAAIPYFRTMFTSKLAESRQEETTIEELDPTALEVLIDFTYTGEVMITTENVQSLLIASEFLQITQVRDSCCSFLSKQLDPTNVMHVRALADGLNCTTLVGSSDCYIRRHFDDFSQTKDYLNLSSSFLYDLIRRNDLRVRSEETVFEAVMRWVKADSENRQSLLPELLTGIRMTLLTPEFLMEYASTEKLVLESFACRDLFDEAKRYHFLPRKRQSGCSFNLSQRRCAQEDHMYLFCWNRSTELNILKYVSETGKCSTLLTDETRLDLEHVLALGDQIYVFRNDSMDRFNPLTCEWTLLGNLPDTSSPVRYAVPYANRIYWLADGFNQSKAYYYEPERNAWYVHEQKVPFSNAEVLAPSFDGIYILNGYFYADTQRQSKIYHPEKGEAMGIPEIGRSRPGFECSLLDGKIYACGGQNSKRTQVYNPLHGQWRPVSKMNSARDYFSLVSCNTKLYAFGGLNGKGEFVRSFECYDPTTDTWCSAGRFDGQYDVVKAVVISKQQT